MHRSLVLAPCFPEPITPQAEPLTHSALNAHHPPAMPRFTKTPPSRGKMWSKT